MTKRKRGEMGEQEQEQEQETTTTTVLDGTNAARRTLVIRATKSSVTKSETERQIER